VLKTGLKATMPRSDEAAAFFHAVYSAVQEIPHGKVTSYAHIAMLVGTRKHPAQPVLDSFTHQSIHAPAATLSQFRVG
jgi:alkylated DNA nucleotide flippase Atl1